MTFSGISSLKKLLYSPFCFYHSIICSVGICNPALAEEGEDIIIDGINYGKEIKVLGEILATDVREKYALTNLVKKEGSGSVIKKGDKVVTK